MTPWSSGPWKACHDAMCPCGQVFAEGDKHVATVKPSTTDSDGTTYAKWSEDERQANYRLIAAAPTLYDELEALLGEYVAATGRLLADYVQRPVEEWPEALTGHRAMIEHADQVLRDARGQS